MTLIPSVMPMLALVGVMVILDQGGTFIAMSAALAGAMALSSTVSTMMQQREDGQRRRQRHAEHQGALEQFDARLEGVAASGRRAMARERGWWERNWLDGRAMAELDTAQWPRLWERRPGDQDFLELLVGRGSRPSCVRFAEDATASATTEMARLIEELRSHADAPLTIQLPVGGTVGVHGATSDVDEFLAFLIAQLASYHSPHEVRLAIISRSEDLAGAGKWFPHARPEHGRAATPLVARTSAELPALLESLASDDTSTAAGIVLVDGRDWDRARSTVERIRSVRPNLAIIAVADDFGDLPPEATFIVGFQGDGSATLAERLMDHDPIQFQPDGLGARELCRFAVTMAPAIDAAANGTRIPPSVGLSQITRGGVPNADMIAASWERRRRAFRLSAPIGIAADGTTAEIDLRRDGPHGLVAGTTGSGKSEFLQSLVLSLAVEIPPDLLNFILVDYKGASTFAEISELPHVVGMVSDLDEQLAGRALRSLRAELRRRERLFAEQNPPAQDIVEYQAARRTEPLPNLVIIIDEFHRLISEHSDFIHEMVTIAQQGRSLGVHLLLATQRPSGVVDEHIRANTNLRVCLRVTDESDSRDVIGAAEAAFIPRSLPGRAYVRIGNEELHPIQAARASGMVSLGPISMVHARRFLPALRGEPVRRGAVGARVVRATAVRAATPRASNQIDQRQLFVRAIVDAAERLSTTPAAAPWLAPLPDLIPLEDLDVGAESRATIGRIDDPANQRQIDLLLDLGLGGILIAGSRQTGKTSALVTIAAALSRWAPLTIAYGIDFGGGDLRLLENLPNCGGVARPEDPAGIRWILQTVKDEVARRTALEPAERASLPRLYVAIDNVGGFWDDLVRDTEDPDAPDDFLRLLDLGRSVGITFALTTDRPSGLRGQIHTFCGTKLALTQADPDEYASMGVDHRQLLPRSVPGRCAIMRGGGTYEAQLAVPDISSETPRAPHVRRISPLPAEFDYVVPGAETDVEGLVLGQREGTHPLLRHPTPEPLVVIGPRRSGRTNLLTVALAEHARHGASSFRIVGARSSAALIEFANGQDDVTYAGDIGQAGTVWPSLIEEIAERQTTFERTGRAPVEELIVVLDDADSLEIPFELEASLERVCLHGEDLAIRLAVAFDAAALRGSYPSGWRRVLLSNNVGVLLNPRTPEDFDAFGVRGRPRPMRPGRGYYCLEGQKTLIQIAKFSTSAEAEE